MPSRQEISPPPKSAPFHEKMAYYRSQHTSKGVRATHLVGIPTVAFSLPLVFGRPKVGVPMFVGGWALQVLGHKVFEKNSPALKNGFLSYQLCGLAFWCEEMVNIFAKLAAKVEGRAAGGTGADAVDGLPPGFGLGARTTAGPVTRP